MIKNNLKNYKLQMILSAVFFLGIGFIGLLSVQGIITEDLWERNLFLKIISIIIGFGFILSLFAYIIILLNNIKPYTKLSNYIKVSHIIVFMLIFDSILPDDVRFLDNAKNQLTVFLILGLYVIISNMMMYIKNLSLNEEDLNLKWEESIKNIKEPITNQTTALSLLNKNIIAIIALYFINTDLSLIGTYIVLPVINVFLLYAYITAIKPEKVQTYIKIGLSIALMGLSITILILLKNFLNSHLSLMVILSLLPSLYLLPNVVKNYYQNTWKHFYEMNFNKEQ